MAQKLIATVVVLLKSRAEGQSKTCVPITSDYIGHTSRTFKDVDGYYTATIYKFRTSQDAVQFDVQSKLDASVDIQKALPMLKEPFMITYSVLRTKDLALPETSMAYEQGKLVGTCVFKFGRNTVALRDGGFPMTELLYGTKDPLGCLVRLSVAADNYDIGMYPNFSAPKGFGQTKNAQVVTPKMKLSSFLGVFLRCKPPSTPSVRYAFSIREVTVTLQELTSSWDSNAEKFNPENAKNCLRNIVLIHRVCNEKFKWEGLPLSNQGRLMWIPKHLFDCQLPNLGPTFMTNSTLRSYGLKILVRLEAAGFSSVYHSFLEINVAQKEWSLPIFGKKNKEFIRSTLVLEKFPKDLFDHSKVTKKIMTNIKLNGFDYLAHHTDAFPTEKSIITVTRVMMNTPQNLLTYSNKTIEEQMEKFGIGALGLGPVTKEECMMIKCEANPSESYGSQYLKTDEATLQYEFPPFQLEARHLCPPSPPTYDTHGDIYMVLDDTKSSNPEAIHAFPGMSLKDLVRIKFARYFNVEGFQLFNVAIQVWEFIRGDYVTDQSIKTRWLEIYNSKFNSAFGKSIDQKRLELKHSFYDCKLPDLGPTFYSNLLSRSYELRATIKYNLRPCVTTCSLPLRVCLKVEKTTPQ